MLGFPSRVAGHDDPRRGPPLAGAFRPRRRHPRRRGHLRAPPRRRARRAAATTPTSSSSTARRGGFVFDEGILKSASRGVSDGPRRARPEGRRHRLRLRRGPRLGRDEARGRDRGADRERRRRRRRPSPSRRLAPSRAATSSSSHARRARPREARAPRARRRGGARLRPAASSRSRRASPRRSARSSSPPATARWSHDVQPLVRFGVRVDRRAGRQAAGGLERRRRAHDAWATSRARSPEWHAREAAAAGHRDARRAGGARRARWRSSSRPATAASSCTKRSATGSRPTSTARARATTAGQIGKPVASELCTVVDDATLLQSRGTINVDDEGNEPQRERPHRERQARRLHARPALGASTSSSRRAATAGARASPARRCRA